MNIQEPQALSIPNHHNGDATTTRLQHSAKVFMEGGQPDKPDSPGTGPTGSGELLGYFTAGKLMMRAEINDNVHMIGI